VNILSAIYAGQAGFLRATESLARRAGNIAQSAPESETLPEDLVGMQVDKAVAEANLSTVKVASSLMSEFIKDTLKK
jgi:hypothetical protein